MCWAVPGKIVEVIDDAIVKVDFGGVFREVLIGFDKVGVGDLVIVHSGVVIGKTSESEIVMNLGLFMEAEKIGLQDLGHTAEEANTKAEEEFRTLLGSLGFDPEKYIPRQAEGPTNMQVENTKEPNVQIPSFAYREKFRTALSDMDYLQVMHYTNYFRLFERAWMGLLASVGYSYSSLIHRCGIFIPTVEVGGQILAPVRMDNEVEIAIWVEEIGRKHIKYHGLLTNLTSKRVAADAYHTAVCTDTTLMESVELPEELKERLTAFMVKK